ncbi:hypothetical protein J4558_15820 [Leptolyngbya sp. 15MV]|nr:hypothetical protein J4558_15820 [Leptolyngbya sp. 15MV]
MEHAARQLDLLEPLVLDAGQQDRLLGLAAEAAGQPGGSHASGAIIADFGQGLLSPVLLQRLCGTLRPRADVLAGDVSGKRSSLRAMRKMDLLCPSESELRAAYHEFDATLPAVVWRMLEETIGRAATITMGPEGAIAFDRLPDADQDRANLVRTRLRAEHVPSMVPYAIDPLGCGDALLATATLSLAAGGSLAAATLLGSVAAGGQAQRIGNLPVSATDVRHGVARLHTAHMAFAPSDVVEASAPRRAVVRAV